MNVAKLLPEIKSADSQQSTGPQPLPQQQPLRDRSAESVEAHWFRVPDALDGELAGRIGSRAVRVYMTLRRLKLRKATELTIKLDALADAAGLSRSTVIRALRPLVSEGMIIRQSGQSKYAPDTFRFPDHWRGVKNDPLRGVRIDPRGVSELTHGGVSELTHQIPDVKEERENGPAGAGGPVQNGEKVAPEDAAAVLGVLTDLQIDRDDGAGFKVMHAARVVWHEAPADAVCAAVRRIGSHLEPDIKSPVGVICYRLQHELHPAVRAAGELHRKSEAAAKDPLHFRPDLKGA
jgi:Bacterial regulatory proteins, gntR family